MENLRKVCNFIRNFLLKAPKTYLGRLENSLLVFLLKFAFGIIVCVAILLLAFSYYMDSLYDEIEKGWPAREVEKLSAVSTSVISTPMYEAYNEVETTLKCTPEVGASNESEVLITELVVEDVEEVCDNEEEENFRPLSDEEYIAEYYTAETDFLGNQFNLDELKILSATIYSEASATTDLQGALAVGWVIRNRFERRGFSSYREVIEQTEPCTQFAVTLLDDWDERVETVLYMDTYRAKVAVTAAKMVLNANNPYELPGEIMYFYGDKDIKEWGSKKYYGTFGGNSFFY